MGVALKLAINYLKANKKRTIIITTCILISTILITTILLLIDSYWEYMINAVRNVSNWEVSYNGITYEEACTIEKHSNVKEISVMMFLGKYEGDDEYQINTNIYGFDENAMKNHVQNNLTEGRLPQNASEVVCDQSNENYSIGDVITQKLENDDVEQYTVVGKIEGYYLPIFNQEQIITLLDRNNLTTTDTVDITLLSYNLKQIYDDYFDIYYMLKANRDTDTNIEDITLYNTTLLEYANVLNYTSDFQKSVYTVEGIFIGIIVISSAIFIYSVINISIIERRRYFGILKSIGSTTKQMKRSIRFELLIILLIAIPLGVIIGILLDVILITVVNNLLPEFASSYTFIASLFEANAEMHVAIPISTIALVIFITILTVYISSIIPIRRVSRMSAINMIKQNKEKSRKKKWRESWLKNGKFLGLKLAWKNVERYKARYSAIIMSLMISISLIIVSDYYIKTAQTTHSTTDYNYYISLDYPKEDDDLTAQIINDIKLSGIATNVVIQPRETNVELLVNKENISDTEKEFSKKIYGANTDLYAHFDCIFADNDYDTILDTFHINIPIVVLDDETYNKYIENVGVDKLENNECILVDFKNEKTKYYDGIRLTNYNEGDEITVKNDYPTHDDLEQYITKLKIKKITNILPPNMYNSIGPAIVTTDEILLNAKKEMFDEDYDETSNYDTLLLKVNNISEADEFASKLTEKYNINRIDWTELVSQEEIDSYGLLRNVFIYSFIFIITLIGVLNMHNAINTNLEIRKREIISLITIGMEQKQINKMLLIENAICGILSLILGSTIGLSVSYLIYRGSDDYIIYSFQVPWGALLISAIAIIIITLVATIYLKKKIFTNNLIETLKKEEI